MIKKNITCVKQLTSNFKLVTADILYYAEGINTEIYIYIYIYIGVASTS